VADIENEKRHVVIYRAMPASAKIIRHGDYVTPSKKFAIEHAVTSAIYNDEPFVVVLKSVPTSDIMGADNPGEFKWTGQGVPAKVVSHVDAEGNVSRASINEDLINKEPSSKANKSAVIIKGNPKYLKGHEGFYNEIKNFLESLGYSVTLDPGTPNTSPPKADLWIGHSRGADRLEGAKPDYAAEVLGIGVPPSSENSFPVINHKKDHPSAGKTPSNFHFIFTDEMKNKIKEFDKDLKEELIKKKGGVAYYQMGGSLPDNLYNRDSKGKPTRDPGIGGKSKSKNKGKDSSKDIESALDKKEKKGKRWYQAKT